MEIVHARQTSAVPFKLQEIRNVDSFKQFEIQISKTTTYSDNDFELQIYTNEFDSYDFKEGDWIYIPETEYIGQVKKIDHSDDDVIKIGGPNIRYTMLQSLVITPPYDENSKSYGDYLYFNRVEANALIKLLINNCILTDETIVQCVSNEASGISISGQARYEYCLDKIVSLLDENNLRLKISHSYDTDIPFTIEAVAPNNFTNELYNSDFDISINSSVDKTQAFNVMAGLGQGDLAERQVIMMLRKVIDGQVYYYEGADAINKYIGNDDINEYVYDYSSAESLDELRESMKVQFEELNKTDEISLEINNDDLDLELGDLVSGADDITGLTINSQITQKTITITSGKVSFKYKVGD